MRAAALAVAVVAAFVGVMYLRFASDSVPPLPAGAGGPQCVVFRPVSEEEGAKAGPTCGPATPVDISPAIQPPAQIVPPTPPPPPDSVGGVKVAPLKLGSDIEFPRYVALIVVTGCDCDAPPTGLRRVYRDPSRSLRTDELFSPEKIGPNSIEAANVQQQVTPWITGFAAAPNGSQLFVGVCTRADCRNPQDKEAEQRLYRSSDGGVTWQDLGDLGPGTYVTNVIRGGEVLVSAYRPSGSLRLANPNRAPPPPEYFFFPGGEILAVPAGANAYWHPTSLTSGEIGWLTEDGRILRSDGTAVLELGRGASPYDFVYGANADKYAVVWSSFEPATDIHTGNILGTITPNGELTQAYSTRVFLRIGAWLDYHVIAGNSYRDAHPAAGFLPSLIDVIFGEVHQIIEPFTDPPFQNGRNDVIAVQRGSFARVVNTDNTCLNIHSAPQIEAPILDCAAEGVLLTLGIGTGDYPNVVDVGGTDWWSVISPTGTEGFASGQYLER